MNDLWKRWLYFVGSLVLLLAFVFVVLPAGKRVPLMGTMLEHNAKSGINVAGFVYTDVERVLVLSHELARDYERAKRAALLIPLSETGESGSDDASSPPNKQQ